MLNAELAAKFYRLRSLAIASCLFLLALLTRLPFCSNHIFTYDAADYFRAARAGFWPQYLGSDAISLADFYAKYSHDSQFRHHPWGPLYAANDGAALRHFHVPFSFYLSAFVNDIDPGTRPQLVATAVISSLTVAAIYLGLTGLGVGLLVAVIVSLFLCFSPVLILAGTNLSPHPLFSLIAILTLFTYCKWRTARSPLRLALLLVGCAVSIASLELSPLLVATLITSFTLHLWSKGATIGFLSSWIKMLASASAGVAALLFFSWPAGVLRGEYLLSYGVFIYQGSVLHDVYFKNRGLLAAIDRLGHGTLPGCALLLFLGLAVYTLLRVPKQMALFVFTLFALLCFAQGMGNGFRNATYASHAVFAISISAALALQVLRSHGRGVEKPAAAVLTGILMLLTAAEAGGLLAASTSEVTHDPDRVSGAIGLLRKQFPPGTSFVVTQDPQAFIMNAPEYHFTLSAAPNSSQPQSWMPANRYYLLVDQEEAQPTDVDLCDGRGLKRFGFAVSCHEILHNGSAPAER